MKEQHPATCAHCGKAFVTSRAGHRFCSNACGSAAWRRLQPRSETPRQPPPNKLPSRPCARCGQPVHGRASNKYCSAACGIAARSEERRGQQRVPRQTCEVCGTSFYAPPVQILRGGGKFCSNDCRFRFMASHPEYFPQTKGRRGHGGRRADLDNRYFRSAWEANYARYLNLLVRQRGILRWEYEVDTFEFPVKRGCRFYTPDFKVWVDDEHFRYHEVKGYMDQKSATKLKRMKKYHPEHRIVLVDAKTYHGIAATVGRIIPHWEQRR